jgi:cytochrome b561
MFKVLRFARIRAGVAARRFSDAATPVLEAPTAYSGGVKVIHWLSGGSVLGCFAYVNLAQQTKDKDAKMSHMFMHKSFGTLAAILMVPRLAVRLTSKLPGPLTSATWEQMLAKTSHFAMYGFLVAMPATGVAMGYFGPKGLPFFTTTLSGMDPAKRKELGTGKWAGQAFKIHKLLGLPMEYLFAMHLSGVGYHIARGHGILARIVPGL